MASKRIDELDARVVADTDLLPVTPSGGPSGRATVAAIVAEGLSQPNSASAGAGASITIKAADGVTSGAGGSITITPGEQASTGGPGKVVIDTLTVGRGKSGVATNTAVGVSALAAVTTGGNNTAIGNSAGALITDGDSNTIVGALAGSIVTGSSNTLIGFNVGLVMKASSGNTGVGRNALGSCSTGQYNTYLGFFAGSAITTGSNNVAVGNDAGRYQADGSTSLTTPANSIYIGNSSRGLNNSDSNSIVIGHIGKGEGANTSVIGNSSTTQSHLYGATQLLGSGAAVTVKPFQRTTSGAGNDVTIQATDGVTSGAGGNITITPGAQATTGGPGKVVIDTLTVGLGKSGVATNTAVGVSALAAVTTGGQNTAIGNSAGALITTAVRNTLVGYLAGQKVTSSSNTLVGSSAGSGMTTGDSNTGVGKSALSSCTTGFGHTTVGADAGASVSTSNNNTLIGFQAATSLQDGSNNVAVGRSAGTFTAASVNVNAIADCVFLGYLTKALTVSDSNSIVIGASATGEGSNTTVIGNSSTVQQHFYATRYIKTEGSLVFASSTPAAITTNQNNYVLTGSGFQRLNCTTASDITGIAPPTGGAHVDGRMIRLVSVGTATVRLMHDDTGSTAANRMYHHNSTNVSLTLNKWADLVYDSTDNGSGAAGWRVVHYA